MSTPPSLNLPPRVRTARIGTASGERAALVAEPEGAPRGTALLVPGYTGSKEDFLPTLPLLATEGWHAVAIDQLGQHESPHAEDAEGYDLHRLGADVNAVIDALALAPVHLLGHSFGGLVVRAATLAATSGTLASLTLLCSGPADIPGPRARTLRMLLDALPHHDLPVIHEQAVALARASGLPDPSPDVAEFLRRRFLGNDPRALRRMGEQLLGEPDRVDDLRRVLVAHDVGALVAHGEADDAWTHAEQEDMAGRLGARYEVVRASAHSPAAEAPEATAALLTEFWAASASA